MLVDIEGLILKTNAQLVAVVLYSVESTVVDIDCSFISSGTKSGRPVYNTIISIERVIIGQATCNEER